MNVLEVHAMWPRLSDELAAPEYGECLARHLVKVLSDGDLSLRGLVRRAAGAYPIVVRDVIQILINQGRVVENEGLYSVNEVALRRSTVGLNAEPRPRATESAQCPSISTRERRFSDPHPADYDWRYTLNCRADLVRRVVQVVECSGRVALLGCPTLLPELANKKRAVVLFDRNERVLRDLGAMGFCEGIVHHDLFDPIPGTTAWYDLVIADPPWYRPFQRAFVLRASELLSNGGLLLLGTLPWLTRPEAPKDRAEVFNFTLGAGFNVAGVEQGVLSYESPRFEVASLQMQGMNCGEWRTGDLWTFKKAREPVEGLATPRPADELQWDEYEVGRRRLKVRRRKEPCPSEFRAEFVDTTAVLGDVSRRNPLRSKIDLWTSDNEAFSVSRLEIMRRALECLQNGEGAQDTTTKLRATYSLSQREVQSLSRILSHFGNLERTSAELVTQSPAHGTNSL
jgi:hypothetical protein